MNVNDLTDWLDETRREIDSFFDTLDEWNEDDYATAIKEHSNIDRIFRCFGEVENAYYKEEIKCT